MVFCLKIKRRVDNIYGRKHEEVAEPAAYTYAVGFRPEMENKMKFRNVDKRRLVIVVAAVIMMGFALSFLNRTNLGTDPCTMFNLGMSRILGLSLGTWQAVFNSFLFIFVFIFAKNQIGWGTLANMFLVGYSFDFFTWLNDKWIPAGAFDPMAVRILVMIPALFIFIIAASAYMGASLGTSPYDAISYILADKIKKVPFRVVRICYDLVVCVAGWALGSTLGVVTVIMSLALGPVITWMTDNVIDKYIISDKK